MPEISAKIAFEEMQNSMDKFFVHPIITTTKQSRGNTMLEGRHIIVHLKEWKSIINALDILEVLLKSKHEDLTSNINNDLLESLQAHFNAEEISKLSDRISRIR